MSYLETLQQHNASLQSLIDTANNLPEAGSGDTSGGTNVKTCTVNLIDDIGSNSTLFLVAAMVYVDGTYQLYSYAPQETDTEATIQNVVCGSRFRFLFETYGYEIGAYVEIEGGAVLYNETIHNPYSNIVSLEFAAPTADGSSTTIHYTGNV